VTSTILSLLVVEMAKYDFVLRIENLYTKLRAYLRNDYFLDVYYNETLQKYSYTVIRSGQRVIGWDNAKHHVNISSYPHHYHGIDGAIEASPLSGDPLQDIISVMSQLKNTLKL